MEHISATAAIIGGGLIGCAIAAELASNGMRDIVVLEKEKHLGQHQSTRNSGVIHAGIYYQPESLKARLCVEGNKILYAFCQQYDVPCKRTGKLVVATNAGEISSLEQILAVAEANGVTGVRMLASREIPPIEPYVQGSAALYVPSTGIVDAATLLQRVRNTAAANGVEFLTSAKVDYIDSVDGLQLQTSRGEIRVDFLINSAGVYAAEVARMVNPTIIYQTTPIKCEYARINRPGIAQCCVYPVPSQETLGIHCTPTFDSSYLIGPSSTPVDEREEYGIDHVPLDKFYQSIVKFMPAIRREDLRKDPHCGVLAKLRNCHDFIIAKDAKYANCIHLLGIDSPGLTASLAIAKYVVSLLADKK